MNELIVIADNLPLTDIFTPENVDAMIGKLETYAAEFEPDATTAKGRAEIKSFSRKFSTSKTYVDGKGKELVEGWKTQAKAVDNQRKRFRETCDRLRDETRQPVTEFENAEKALIAAQNRTLARLVDLYNSPGDLAVDVFKSLISEVEAIVIEGDILSDYYTRGNREREQTLQSLRQKLEAKIQHDKDQEELAALRAEKEKKDAAAAKKKAAKEQKDREARIRKEEKDKAEAEKKRAVEQARKDEQQKAELERKAKETEARLEREAGEKKAANKKHRAKIEGEIVSAIMSCWTISEGQATSLVASIAAGDFTHLKINY